MSAQECNRCGIAACDLPVRLCAPRFWRWGGPVTDADRENLISEEILELACDGMQAVHGGRMVADNAEVTGALLAALRHQWATELADAFHHRLEIAQRTPESERSGVREGMVVTWISAEKLTREYGETKP